RPKFTHLDRVILGSLLRHASHDRVADIPRGWNALICGVDSSRARIAILDGHALVRGDLSSPLFRDRPDDRVASLPSLLASLGNHHGSLSLFLAPVGHAHRELSFDHAGLRYHDGSLSLFFMPLRAVNRVIPLPLLFLGLGHHDSLLSLLLTDLGNAHGI